MQEDDYSRIVGLGTDGAAVMTGHHGLGVKLKQLNNNHTGLILLLLRQVRTLIILNGLKGR